MNGTEENSSAQIEAQESPAWLVNLLRVASESALLDLSDQEPAPPELLNRYRTAADVALNLAHLHKERDRIGFVPLSIADYVNGLVKVTNVSLGPILSWLGVGDLAELGPRSARAFAKLTRVLGINVREALIHLRIGLAEQVDSAPMPLLVARQRSSGTFRNHLEECEAVLSDIESEYDLDCLRELRAAEFEVRAAYKQ
jgi:hypothetical protein